MNYRKNIALIGVNLGGGNLGEEVTAAALLQNIRLANPNCHIIEITSNPGDTRMRHNVKTIPLSLAAESRVIGMVKNNYDMLHIHKKIHSQPRTTNPTIAAIKKIPFLVTTAAFLRSLGSTILKIPAEISFLLRSNARLKEVDYIISGGSGPLSDNFGGAWAYPFILAKWSLLARVNRIPMAFFSVGAVPFESSLSKFFVRYAVNCAESISYRDHTSKKIIEGLGVNKSGEVFPDVAFAYEYEHSDKNHSSLKKIGISLFPHFDSRYWPEQDDSKYQNYISKMVEVCKWLVNEKYLIVFMSTQVRSDVLVLKDVLARLSDAGLHDGDYEIDKSETHEEFIKRAVTLEAIIVTRFHGMILSLLSNIPVIALANQPKMVDLMKDMNQEKLLLEVDKFTLDDVKYKIQLIVNHKDQIKSEIKGICDRNRTLLQRGISNLVSKSPDDV